MCIKGGEVWHCREGECEPIRSTHLLFKHFYYEEEPIRRKLAWKMWEELKRLVSCSRWTKRLHQGWRWNRYFSELWNRWESKNKNKNVREKKKQVPLCVYLLLQAPLHHWTWSIDRVSLPVKRESFCCWSQLRTPAPVCHSFSITQLASAHWSRAHPFHTSALVPLTPHLTAVSLYTTKAPRHSFWPSACNKDLKWQAPRSLSRIQISDTHLCLPENLS